MPFSRILKRTLFFGLFLILTFNLVWAQLHYNTCIYHNKNYAGDSDPTVTPEEIPYFLEDYYSSKIMTYENESIPVSLIIDESSKQKYYLAVGVRIGIDALYDSKLTQEERNKKIEYIDMPRTMTMKEFEEFSSKSNITPLWSYTISMYIIAPSYWDIASTITVKLKVVNNGPLPFVYSGNAVAYIKDQYNYPGGWVTEASGSKYVSFILYYRQSIWIYIRVSIGYRSVGLKKVMAGLHFNWGDWLADAGYNFVQRFNKNEYVQPSGGNYFELSDQFHHNSWTIIKRAGIAVDDIYSNIVLLRDAAIKVMHWIHSAFVYDKNWILFEENGKVFRTKDLTAADLYIMNNLYDEYLRYHGTCDEYSTLYISFLRALNIPARYLIITFIEEDSQGNLRNSSHAFAEVWVEVPQSGWYTWMHVDPTWNVYNNPRVYIDSPNIIKIWNVAIWYGADDTISPKDIRQDDLLLATNVSIIKALPYRNPSDGIMEADFEGIQYTGPNDYK
ncbi:MAG: transglutaminase domain-containing protein [Candidatus Asgardarchaeum sp.]